MSANRAGGFSLIELMITILVVAILTAVAWPSFRDFMHRNTVASQSNQVLAAMQYARNEAVTRRYPVALCASTSGTACTSGTNFEEGWMIWRDSALSGIPSYSAAAKDELLRVTSAQNGVSIRSFGGSGTADLIAFDQRGAVMGAGGGVTNIVVCAKTSSSDSLGENTARVPGKYVRVDPSGRITVQSLATADTCDQAPAS